MSRRPVAAVLLAAIALGVPMSALAQPATATGDAASAAGHPATASDDAATINGTRITFDRFSEALESTGAPEETDTEFADGDAARTLLSSMIVNEAMRQFLIANDVEPVTSADASVASESGVHEAVRQAYSAQLADIAVPAGDLSSEQYDTDPASFGVLCFRVILAADSAAGNDVVEALEAGEPFAEVGEQYSVDPGFAETGGSPTGDPDQTCIPVSDVRGVGPELSVPLLDARPGEPIGPIETQGGVLVLVVDSFDDAGPSVAALYATPPSDASVGQLMFDGWLLGADIAVNPRVGRWDAATATVVTLGQA
jgi:hypothetical protein